MRLKMLWLLLLSFAPIFSLADDQNSIASNSNHWVPSILEMDKARQIAAPYLRSIWPSERDPLRSTFRGYGVYEEGRKIIILVPAPENDVLKKANNEIDRLGPFVPFPPFIKVDFVNAKVIAPPITSNSLPKKEEFSDNNSAHSDAGPRMKVQLEE